MTAIRPLDPPLLRRRCEADRFGFETTADLEELTGFIGQSRALDAVHFGIDIEREGYNLYAMGPSGIGKHTLVRQYLEQRAEEREPPPDLCYVNNFDQPHKPRSLRLPPGRGADLRRDMEQLVEELRTAIQAVFGGDEYRTRVQALEDELKEKQENAFNGLSEEAEKHDIKLFRTPGGFAFAPVKEGEVLGPDEFQKLPEQEQHRIEEIVSNLQERLQAIIRKIPQWRKDSRDRVKALNEEMSAAAVNPAVDAIAANYADMAPVSAYLEAVRRDAIENVDDFLKGEESEPGQGEPQALRRYRVNLLVDNSHRSGAPVIYSDHPGYQNLVGRVEHIAQFGTLVTDFNLIKPGALHEASGGYLMVDVRKLLTQPYAWEALKRALYANEIRIESLERMLSLASTVSLEPEPVPLNAKLVLLGDRLLYYLLHEYDPDFPELFKVAADFEEEVDRSEENDRLYARLVATLARKEGLRPFDRHAVARIIEHGARLVEDSEKLSTHMRSITDLMHESDYRAGAENRDRVTVDDIQAAIDAQIRRASRVQEKIREEMERHTILVDTEGETVGQANGLSVIRMGNYAFGQPSRITASVHLGEGDVVNIEREVELSGSIHSKGVLILSSFLAARYAERQPLSLSASLVFEQSYGMVDGDSASLAELCTLLSAVGRVPLRQSLALTGSIDQHGRVQPIGGVNEKIEGFFDLCLRRGLKHGQGVLIPESNVKHLMLRNDVVEAAKAGRFQIYAVKTVDEAIGLLTGLEAGAKGPDGRYPDNTVNGRVQQALEEMTRARQEFAEAARHKDDDHDDHRDGRDDH